MPGVLFDSTPETGGVLYDSVEQKVLFEPENCPPANPCTLDLTFTSGVYNVLQTGLPINPDVCDTLGWNGKWTENCIGTSCGEATKYCVALDRPSCVCGTRLEWIEDVGEVNVARVRIILDKIVGDGVLADGWYLWASAEFPRHEDSTCHWETAYCTSFPCTCVYLGDLTVFDTMFSISIPMIEDPFFTCSGDGTLDLTFYPC